MKHLDTVVELDLIPPIISSWTMSYVPIGYVTLFGGVGVGGGAILRAWRLEHGKAAGPPPIETLTMRPSMVSLWRLEGGRYGDVSQTSHELASRLSSAHCNESSKLYLELDVLSSRRG